MWNDFDVEFLWSNQYAAHVTCVTPSVSQAFRTLPATNFHSLWINVQQANVLATLNEKAPSFYPLALLGLSAKIERYNVR